MAPKRKQTKPAVAVAVSVSLSVDDDRVVRRSPRLAASTVASPAADPEPPKRKKTKTTTNSGEGEAAATDPEPPKKKKTKTKNPANAAVEKSEAEAPPSKTIIIEHCKQCNSFKTRAVQVKNALEKDVAGVNVVVNPEKPRRGCFEIREEGGHIFVSLLDMKRPFQPMKKLDMEKLISDIVEKIQ